MRRWLLPNGKNCLWGASPQQNSALGPRGPATATSIAFSERWHFQVTLVACAAEEEEDGCVHPGLGLPVTAMGQGSAGKAEPLRVTPNPELSGQT